MARVYTSGVKPPLWNFKRSKVAPEWRWFWRENVRIAMPLLAGTAIDVAGNYNPTLGGTDIKWDAGILGRRFTGATGSGGAYINFGNHADIDFDVDKVWTVGAVVEATNTADDERVIISRRESGSQPTWKQLGCRTDKIGAGGKINWTVGAGASQTTSTALILNTPYLIIISNDGTTSYLRVWELNGNLYDSDSRITAGNAAGLDQQELWFAGSYSASNDPFRGSLYTGFVINDYAMPDKRQRKLAIDSFGPFRPQRRIAVAPIQGQAISIGTAVASWQGQSVTPQLGGISQSVVPAVGNWQGVSVSPQLGAISQAVGPAAASWQAIGVGVQLGGVNVAVGPATGAWQAVALSAQLGGIVQAVSPATGAWQAVVVTPSTGGQLIAVGPASAQWQAVALSSQVGPITQLLNAALSAWQAVAVTPQPGGISQAVGPAAGSWQGVQVNPLTGALSVPVGPALATWQAIAISTQVGPIVVLISPAIATWQAVQLIVAGIAPVLEQPLTVDWILQSRTIVFVLQDRSADFTPQRRQVEYHG